MKARSSFVTLVVVGGLAGCAYTQPLHSASSAGQQGDPNHLVIHAQSQFIDALVTPTAMTGPNINISRSASGLRGEAYGRPVNLSVDPQAEKVDGVIGRQPVQLTVRREGEQVRVQGLLGGRLSDFVTSPQAIQGKIGPCSYQLVWTGGAYEGSRACRRGQIEPMELRIPVSMSQWTPPEFIASLGVFLSARG